MLKALVGFWGGALVAKVRVLMVPGVPGSLELPRVPTTLEDVSFERSNCTRCSSVPQCWVGADQQALALER